MKYLKFISICLLATFAVNVSAEITAQAKIKVTGDLGGVYEEVKLWADDAAAANFADKNNAPFTKGTSNLAVEVYAMNGADKYSAVVLPELSGLKLKFVANAYETAYTMTFSDVMGTIVLKAQDTTIVVDATKEYKFTCSLSGSKEFTVAVYQTYERKDMSAGEWGTICLPWSSVELDGVTTFYDILGFKSAKNGIAIAKVSALEAGKPYMFQLNATSTKLTVTYDPTTEVAAPATMANVVGSFTGCTVPKDMYIVKNNTLEKVADATTSIAANEVYFDVDKMTTSGSDPRTIYYFGEKETGIQEIVAGGKMQGKMIIDGQLVIIKDGKVFNAQGAKL